MMERYRAFIVAVVVLGPGIYFFMDLQVSGEPTRLDVDGSAYRIAPLIEVSSTMEDEEYRSRYFSMMGPMNVNSFLTDADWLSWEYSSPLNMNTTDNEGYWNFDRGTAADGSGNSNDGTLHGPVSVQGITAAGQAFSFDGDDDYIEIPHSDSLNISSEITVEAWIYPTFSDSGEHMVVSKGGNWNTEDPQCYELTIDKDRPLFQMKVSGSEQWYGAAPAEPITKNTWHHVAGVYDGIRFYIYIDGINQTSLYNGWSDDYQGEIYKDDLPTSEHNISIGRRLPATWGALYYEGYIDDVRIWDRAISADEMKEHAVIPGTRCLDIFGTPDNGDVGNPGVIINVTDGDGRYDERRSWINVQNVPPAITSNDVLEVRQDGNYTVQYTSDEIGGDITWSVDTEADWLTMETDTGILSGIPDYSDVGTHQVTVTVDDGNGGTDSSAFDLQVMDVNDPPRIMTENILSATEDQYFEVDYDAEDPDGEDLTWSMVTDSNWLSLDEELGILNGTPTNDDVGFHNVNITVHDPRGLTDSTEFVIEVINVNDAPIWVDVPVNSTIEEGKVYTYDIEASDVDLDDEITYQISTFPEAEIEFNSSTGVLKWNTTRSIFSEGDYTLSFLTKATDGKETISHAFHVELLPDPSPTVSLLSPSNGSRSINITTLSWEGSDNGDQPLSFDVYLGTEYSTVISLSEPSLIAEGIRENTLDVKDLEPGETYYWMVIPNDRFSSGRCLDRAFSFSVNSPPSATLTFPEDESVVPCHDLVIESVGSDTDDDELVYHYYISTAIDDVKNKLETAHRTGGTELTLQDLQPGSVYYWTVIPEDELEYGRCRSGVFSFTVNIPPVIDDVADHEALVGSEIVVSINGTDQDASLSDVFEFSLLEGPGRIVLESTTSGTSSACVLRWTPVEADIGTNTITVQLTDGLDPVNISFRIEVQEADTSPEEKEEEGSFTGILIAAGIVLALLALGVIILLLVMKRRKGSDEEIETPDQPTDNEEQVQDFMDGTQGEGETIEENQIPPDPLASPDHAEPGPVSSTPTRNANAEPLAQSAETEPEQTEGATGSAQGSDAQPTQAQKTEAAETGSADEIQREQQPEIVDR